MCPNYDDGFPEDFDDFSDYDDFEEEYQDNEYQSSSGFTWVSLHRPSTNSRLEWCVCPCPPRS